MQITNISNNVLNTKTNKPPVFGKKIKLPSGVYPYRDVVDAKNCLLSGRSNWQVELYDKVYSRRKAPDDHRTILPNDDNLDYVPKAAAVADKIALAVATGGLSVVGLQIRAYQKYHRPAKRAVEYMSKIVTDLKSIKLKEDAAKIKKQEKNAINRLEYNNKMDGFKEKEIRPKILDLFLRKKENKPTEMPNNIMFTNSDERVNESLIEWTKKNADANVITVDTKKDDLLEVLEQAEEHYQQTGEWNLIHAKNMDELINPKKADETTIESMKDIMSATSGDYHSTIVFSTQEPRNLDSIAIQPHRVKEINSSDIQSPEKLAIEEAKIRIKNKVAQKETPVSVINDILHVVYEDPTAELPWENAHSKSVINGIRKGLQRVLLKGEEKFPEAKSRKIPSPSEEEITKFGSEEAFRINQEYFNLILPKEDGSPKRSQGYYNMPIPGKDAFPGGVELMNIFDQVSKNLI